MTPTPTETMIIARVRGRDYQLIKDHWALPSALSQLNIVKAMPPRLVWELGSDLTSAMQVEVYYLAYYEYEIDKTGVTKIHVYLPEGVKPPREGVGR